ncbi:MAG: GldG family protein [Hyphomonadaceae bacterium]
MSGRRFAIIVGLCLFVLFVATNLIANSWLRAARLDLTENQLYSLSSGTRQIIRDIDEPLQLTFFYSREAAARYPAIQTYAARVRELLAAYAARSGGRIRVVEVDPRVFTEAEDQATEAGVQAVPVQQGADPIYFGLAGANSVDDRRAIPFFAPDREAFLEYEVTRLIYELENPDLPRIGLITSLPIDPANADVAAAAGQPQSQFATELGRLLDVVTLDPTFSAIPADVDVLAIIHPYPLTPAQLFAIDQFVLARGRAFIALDPASMLSMQQSFNPLTGPSTTAPSSNLEPLLSRWGIAISQDVVLDLEDALRVQDTAGGAQGIPQPLFFLAPPTRMDREDLMTAWLGQGVSFAAAGALAVSERPDIDARILVHTSPQTMRIPAQAAMMRPSPVELLQNWIPANRSETIAVHLSGQLETAYPNTLPEGVEAPAQRLARSQTTAQIVIVADSDFLADELYMNPQGAAFADNGSFALNAIDVLSGSDAMVSLRSRARSVRRMDVLDRMENEAQQRIQQRQNELQRDLQVTEARLGELQQRGQGSGYFAGNLGAELTREERAEVERFQSRVADTRRQLREVGRDLRAGVETLEGWTIFLNMWLPPILVAGVGVYVFWRRRRRTHEGRRP